jgi:hypothetical protein
MVWFLDEEHDQIFARLRLTEGSVYILGSAMSLLHEAKLHTRALKDLGNLLAGDSVADCQYDFLLLSVSQQVDEFVGGEGVGGVGAFR